MASSRNKKIAKEAEEKTSKIRSETAELLKLQKRVDNEDQLLRKLQAGVFGCLNVSMKLRSRFPSSKRLLCRSEGRFSRAIR